MLESSRSEYPIEDKIKLLMVIKGCKSDRIYFSGQTKDRYLRFEYWNPVSNKIKEYIHKHTGIDLHYVDFYEEDCGWLCFYELH